MKKRRGEKKTSSSGAILLLAISASLFFALSAHGQEVSVKAKFQNGDFPLVYKNRTAEIFVSDEDFKVVSIAANEFASDVESVAGVKPPVKSVSENLTKNIVIIGTLGKNALIESLIKSGKLNVSKIANKRECFQIESVKNPFPGVAQALVIAGSDRRGTA